MSSKAKWVVLTSYIAIIAVSQMLWLNFSPIASDLQPQLGVSLSAFGWLTMAALALYIVLSVPAGMFIDRYGYRKAIIIAGLVMTISAAIRIQGSYTALLVGQIGIGIVQPLILNSISKLVADWFEESHIMLATGLGTVGLFLGMIIGMGLSPVLYQNYGLISMMVIFAIVTVLSTIGFMVFGRSNASHVEEKVAVSFKAIKQLCVHRNLLTMYCVSFLSIGVFNSLMTWLEEILASHGINAETSGLIGALMLIAGVVGSIIIPAISDKINRRKVFLFAAVFVSMLALYPMAQGYHSIVFGIILGFAFLPGYAVILTMVEKQAGFALAGSATSLLLLAGNAGGVVIGDMMERLSHDQSGWMGSVWVAIVLLVLCLLLIVFSLKEVKHD